jgi:hypothetical protein
MMVPIYKAWTKGLCGEPLPPCHSLNWGVARRAWLKVYRDRIECGDWIVPASSVSEAVVFHCRMWGIVPVKVLAITSNEQTWQFGLNPWSRIASTLPFQVRHERLRLVFSLAQTRPTVRLGLVAVAMLGLGLLLAT